MKVKGPGVHRTITAVALIPLGITVYQFFNDSLGPEPVDTLTHRSGEWALRMLILCLAITPLRNAFGWTFLAPYRRTFGLLAFFYASLHFWVHLTFELDFKLGDLAEDIRERPYITVGFTALMLLLPLAITSTRGWIRRLGGVRWRKLHQLIYPAAILAVVHYAWGVKADLRGPLIFAAILTLLLAYRWVRAVKQKAEKYATIRYPPGPE